LAFDGVGTRLVDRGRLVHRAPDHGNLLRAADRAGRVELRAHGLDRAQRRGVASGVPGHALRLRSTPNAVLIQSLSRLIEHVSPGADSKIAAASEDARIFLRETVERVTDPSEQSVSLVWRTR